MLLRHIGLVLAVAAIVGCEEQERSAAETTQNPLADVPRDELYNALRTAKPMWNRWCVDHYRTPGDPANRGNDEFCLRDMPELLVEQLNRQGYAVTMADIQDPWVWEFMDQRMQPIWECESIELAKPILESDRDSCDPWQQEHGHGF